MITKNLRAVMRKKADAALRSGRSPDDVRLILATKTVPSERVLEAMRLGQVDLGENKVQEGGAKAAAISLEVASEYVRWSMIGHLQSNKVKEVLGFATEVQSLDRLTLAQALDRQLQRRGHGLDVFVQVNTSGETSKYGLAPEKVPGFLQSLTAYDTLRPRGFMTLARFSGDAEETRQCFRKLRLVRDRAMRDAPQGGQLRGLSMGMSGDYELAIEEGATVIRIGQAVFGERAVPDARYWPGDMIPQGGTA